MRTFLYIIGEPGSGKSTLVRELTAGRSYFETADPVPHVLWGGGEVVEIGRYRGSFSGTDGLAMNIQPAVVRWLEQFPHRNIMAEGDRLANAKFFNAVKEGYELRVVYLHIAEGVAEARRATRAIELGVKPQNEQWVRGRKTKALRLAHEFQAHSLYATGRTPTELVKDLRMEGLDPFEPSIATYKGGLR